MQFKQLFLKQKMMRTVLLSLIPIYIFSVYLFGLRVLLLGLVVTILGVVTEFLILRNINKKNVKVSEAVFVTCILYTLTLPPTIPFWIAGLGIVFGVFFAKGIFGGFGMNVFNPALAGRCFIYISFAKYTAQTWSIPFHGFPGGFFEFIPSADMITTATPLKVMLDTGKSENILNLFLGNISGSIGETSGLLILLAGGYLLYKKVADFRIILSTILSFLLISSIMFFTKNDIGNPLFSILSGGFLFGAFFMATDPISAPKDKTSKYIYGALIGLLSFTIRRFSLFTEGVMFSILIANMFGPLIDKYVKDFKKNSSLKLKGAKE